MESFIQYEHLQIEEVCRICLTKKDQMNLIYEAGLADMLLECASVQVTPENGLFNLVCSECRSEVSRWYVFKQQVVRSFEIGKWLLARKSKACEHALPPEPPKVETDTSAEAPDVERPDLAQTEPERLTELKSEPAKGAELVCKVCGKLCASTNSYNRHTRTHDDARPFVCCKCDKPFKTAQVLSEHMKRHYDDRRHQCGLCARKFYSKASLTDHLRSHTGERPFGCAECGRSFGTRAVLRQHAAVHTVRERKHRCDVCGKCLLTAGSLETHVRKHSGVRPFACAGCERRFFTKEAMQRHFAAIHDTDNNFLCSVCSKVCSTKVHLSNHTRKKHLGLGRPPDAVCAECGKQCGSAAELRVHARVHTGERPFVCDVCGKGFIARGNLNSHRQRHTGERPFLCKHCGKAFGEKSTLKVHERIHTGEQPYKCAVCGKAYVQSGALRTHMKTHWKQ